MSVALAHLLSNNSQQQDQFDSNVNCPNLYSLATDSLQLQRGLTLLYNLANSNRHTSHFDQLVMVGVGEVFWILTNQRRPPMMNDADSLSYII